MSSCNLEIEIASDRYRGGDDLSGTLVVTSDERFECKTVKVELCRFVHGRGNRQHKAVESLELQRGSVAAGVTRLPFQFTLPNGPNSYHGTYLNVDWQIDARVPWRGRSTPRPAAISCWRVARTRLTRGP